MRPEASLGLFGLDGETYEVRSGGRIVGTVRLTHAGWEAFDLEGKRRGGGTREQDAAHALRDALINDKDPGAALAPGSSGCNGAV